MKNVEYLTEKFKHFDEYAKSICGIKPILYFCKMTKTGAFTFKNKAQFVALFNH